MSNIYNHNREPFSIRLNYDEYWDFHVSLDDGVYLDDGLTERCLSSYIDFNDPECVWFDEIKSKEQYVWEYSKNNNVTLNYIGSTAVDNGFYHYDKNRIDNAMFYEIFLHSILTLDSDNRLTLNKVNGNNKIYEYPLDLVEEDGMMVAKACGGFYQGFFKLEGYDYQTLPQHLGNGLDFEITLKKSDIEYNHKFNILNDVYPENKGIFFYMGTRSENKWWKYYDSKTQFPQKDIWYFDSEYIKDEFYNNVDYANNISYFEEFDYILNSENPEPYFSIDGYYQPSTNCLCGESYVESGYLCDGYQTYLGESMLNYNEDGYVKKEIYLDEDSFVMSDSEGNNFKTPIITNSYHTDNKFLFFDRTKEGYTTKTWDPNYDITVTMPKLPDIGNYFLLFNRTKNGLTTKTINKTINNKLQEYDVLKDIYRNAFAMQITDDGRIGFKYAVKDCESEEPSIKILDDFSESGVIKDNVWHTIHVKILPVKSRFRDENPECTVITNANDTMKIFIFVDGRLVLISEDLPIFNFKPLNDYKTKQEGVPYNISIGGGTQGLCDVVYLNYRKYPYAILPIEQNFAGSFIGYIKDFKFYTCPLKFNEIKNNFIFNQRFFTLS